MPTERTIALIDMDCFYVQVEEKYNPEIKGRPAAVVQYNGWKGGGIIAVNYEARAHGVNRHIRGDEAKSICPEIILVKVPELRGKADLGRYRSASTSVLQTLANFPGCIIERASVDEAYIDLTAAVQSRLNSKNTDEIIQNLTIDNFKNNYILGSGEIHDWIKDFNSEDLDLILGAEIVGEMRKMIEIETGFKCSAGIARNKVIAKLACGLNKPNKQTVVPQCSIPELYKSTPIQKLRNLGGKFGEQIINKLSVQMMGDLYQFEISNLVQLFGEKGGTWLYNLARGLDDEPVQQRQLPKSIGCNKMFNGPEALEEKEKVKYWLAQLTAEVVERLEKDLLENSRRATTLTLSIKFENQSQVSRTLRIIKYDNGKLVGDVNSVLDKLYGVHGHHKINSLGLSASQFEDSIEGTTKISSYFKKSATIPGDLQGASASTSSGNCTTTDTVDDHCDSDPPDNNSTATISGGGFFNRDHEDKDEDEPIIILQEPNSSGNSKIETPITQEQQIPSSSSSSPTKSMLKTCTKCGKEILAWEFDLHSDYHYAKELSRELNGSGSVGVTVMGQGQERSASTSTSRSSGRKGSPLKKKAKRSNEKGMKTLDNYFVPN